VCNCNKSWQAAGMATKQDLMPWVEEALTELGGRGTVVEVCEVVWRRHELDLRNSGSLFYTWQYDIRWAAQKLRDSGRLKPIAQRRSGVPWELA
jgi:hypothetical protein